MYPVNTHFKPVVGIDIHFTIIPPPVLPLPYPHIGMILDPMDYIPFIGSSVSVNGVPRGVSNTSGILITWIHFPWGVSFLLAPMIGHDNRNFFGSTTVTADGDKLAGSNYMTMSCNDIGIPLSLNWGKKWYKPIPSLYAPTSYIVPLQLGAPVILGTPLVPPSLGQFLKGLAMSLAMSGLFKLAGKIFKKGLTKFNNAVLKNSPRTQKLSAFLCKHGFEPVDLVTGRVTYETTDFELPGPIPLRWKKVWDSDSNYCGSLGYGYSLNYDRDIQTIPEENALLVSLEDGRVASFPMLQPGEKEYHPHESLTLSRKENGYYLLEDHNSSLYYHFEFELRNGGLIKLTRIENYSGHQVKLHYNGRHLSAMTDSAGRRLQFTTDRRGCITKVTVQHKDMSEVLMQYAYNDQQELIAITDALGQTTSVEYDDGHRMVKKTDREGQSFYWEYDKKGRCVHTWGDGGLLEGRIEYNKGFNKVTNSLGEHTYYYFDENNLCVQETDHYGNSRYTEYTNEGKVYREIDETGNLTGYVYDEEAQLKEKVLPDGNVIKFNYNDNHQIIIIINPDGSSQVHGFDKNKRLASINYPNGGFTKYKYNDKGLIKEITTKSQTSLLQYDEDGNLIQLQLPDKVDAIWVYDALGRCIKSINPEGQVRTLKYDALNRVKEMLLPDGNFIQLEYNAYEEVVIAKDKNSQVSYEYTPMGSLKKRKQNNVELTYNYDTEERLQSIINEADKHYIFGYNKRGEITKEVGFDGLQRLYKRDPAGKIIEVLRPGNKYTKYEYNGNGKITRAQHHDGSWENYSYDKNGNLTEAVNEDSIITFKRNKLGLTEEENQNGYTVSSGYDELGNRASIKSSLGADITMKRNTQGKVTDMQAKVNELLWSVQYKYNKAGQEIEKLLPGNIHAEWKYDQAGRSTEHKVRRDGIILRWKKYTWDTSGKLNTIFDALAQSNTQFGYDTFGNLTWAQYANNGIVHKATDDTGNIYETKERSDRKYNAAGALLESNTHLYKYDDEGNLISKTEKATHKKWQYQWYASGTLKAVTQPDDKVVQFKYDALGRRIEKSFNGEVTRFVWDGNVLIHEWKYRETERPSAVVNEWGEISYDKQEPVENLTSWVFDPETYIPVAKFTGNGRTYSIVSDGMGTPQEMYDEKGVKVWEGIMDILGKTISITGDRSEMPFKYQGQYEDLETGLYYNRFRYYSPEEGTYISQDPSRLKGGHRLYAFVTDINKFIDTFGLNPEYYPLDSLGRPTGGIAEVNSSTLGTGTDAGIDPPGWEGGGHPHHQQRGHLIANNHGGSGTDARNIVTITDGTNHPGMTKVENSITKHVKSGNTVLVEVKPHYNGNDLVPSHISIYAIDQDGKVVADSTVQNGLRQNTSCCRP